MNRIPIQLELLGVLVVNKTLMTSTTLYLRTVCVCNKWYCTSQFRQIVICRQASMPGIEMLQKCNWCIQLNIESILIIKVSQTVQVLLWIPLWSHATEKVQACKRSQLTRFIILIPRSVVHSRTIIIIF